MKKIGILFGMENSFPEAFVQRVNELGKKSYQAEPVSIDKIMQGEPLGYDVIIDRISQDVPFYRAALKNAAITGTAVINNPFWWSADEKFFNNALALQVGVPVPKTVLLPSRERPTDTQELSFRNLKYPLDWEGIFEYVGFPAYMKPHAGGGWKSVYKLHDMDDFFQKFEETGQLVMMLQEEIIFEEYFRCYCIGGKYVRIMQYEPRNPHHLRYVVNTGPASEALLQKIEDYVLRLNHALGYDFNTVEFAVRNGVPYAIDFCNPAPDAEASSVGQENFDWVVETAAKYAIERAKAHKKNKMNLTWGTFLQFGVEGTIVSAKAPTPAQ
jgi:glutathione synthase/RimK-type ligase-like ATP-grasp enzyme